ncbi:MAG TPA: DUF5916 domain-containing protein [Candidatus Eisenbacteria bacterium]|nr:DUF5916 domain-containing protein [Candidatus Eisenbacteria bacterium]
MMPTHLVTRRLIRFVVHLLFVPGLALAADPKPGPPLTIKRAAGPIVADGDLSDAGWQGAEPITTWFETRVGDNVEPQVKNTAYLAYDDHYFYAGFVFDDPSPPTVRAPLGDHDALGGSTDYGGVIVDSRNDGKTAQMFLANARGLQYDALTSDVSGEDSAPDFFWDAVGKVTDTGWTLELRIPFTSLRYAEAESPTWGILLYRNYPRDRRYQFFSARLPRDVNCFICNSSKLTGLASLPKGSHLVVAPYGTTTRTSVAGNGLGQPLTNEPVDAEAGLDVKWSPIANMAVDATINPDFSQVESDAAQIAANERFALSFPEKRPFFLEGVDMVSTPLTAVYTRAVTSPRFGVRATGRAGSTAYTAVVVQDRGDGLVILPGAEGSDAAFQDFISDVGIARVRRDLGLSFVSMLATTREIHGGGSNRVFGPDFQWRPRSTDSFTGQFLWSESQTPKRTDLTPEWDGRKLSDGGGLLYWSHSTGKQDWFVQGLSIGTQFRADNGFIPQVGYRELFFDAGYTIRPKDTFLNRVRFFTTEWYDETPNGDVLSRRVSVGTGMDGGFNSFIRVELNQDAIRSGGVLFRRFQPRFILEASPSSFFNQFSFDARAGEEIDFDNGREGHGASLASGVTLRPGDHLALRADVSRRWLNVDAGGGLSGRLFTAQVERVRANWSFNSRAFLRLIGQYVETRRDPALYTFPVNPKQASFSSSALFAYKLNWQTVLFTGFGDQQSFDTATQQLQASGRQLFAKVSYAWQH